MTSKTKYTLIILIAIYYLITKGIGGANALEFGSDRFVEFTRGASDYPTLVRMGHDPNINSNMYFTNKDYVKAMRGFPFSGGSGHKHMAASMMNFQGNYVMAGAKTDPRSPNFISHSLGGMLENPESEIELVEGIKASKLGAAQSGDNAKRYIASEIIEPNPGFYQSADNQQAFESAYDNVLLGMAEEALFEGDQIQATEYFNDQLSKYKNETNKQMTASSYQKDAILRQKETAEKFRDFFQMKAMVSKQNLSLMPTKESLVQNCQGNTPMNEDSHAIYNRGMPSSESSFYGLSQPSYNFDFCEQYVSNEESYLLQNLPVHQELKDLINDSEEMVSGLDEISQELSRRDLSLEDIASVFSNNQAWQTLSKRSMAYKECNKINCLASAEKSLGKMVNYPGAEEHRNSETSSLREVIKSVIRTKRLPFSSKGSKGFNGAGARTLLGQNQLQKRNKENTSLKKKLRNNVMRGIANINLTDSFKKSKFSKNPSSLSERRFSRGRGYYRGKDEVLRGPSGKPVQGFESKPDKSIWKIISRRYKIKMMSLL